MSKTIDVYVGSIEEMGKRFVGAWHRLERGKTVGETHMTFYDLETMMATLSPKRLALLRHVHHQPAATIAGLARTLSRDYKRIHEDVTTLLRAGLIVRDEKGIRAPYDSVRATVSLDA